MKHILLVITFVLFLSPIQSVVVQADEAFIRNDITAYKEYDSFLKRYYEHISELGYFVEASKNQNEYYFREMFDSYRDAIDKVYDKDDFLSRLLDLNNVEDLMAKPVALLSTFKDLRTYIFDRIKNVYNTPEVVGETLSVESFYNGSLNVSAPTGYHFAIGGDVFVHQYKMYSVYYDSYYGAINFAAYRLDNGNYLERRFYPPPATAHLSQITLYNQVKTKLENSTLNKSDFYTFWYAMNNPSITLKENQGTGVYPTLQDSYPTDLVKELENIINNFNDDNRINTDYSPNITPFLVCPSGQNVDLQYDDTSSQFYTLERTRSLITININSDGSATYNNEDCNLDFKFPTIEINVNGEVTADGESLIAATSTGDGGNNDSLEDLDQSLLDYVKNAYDFATSTINTGVEGLKSIVLGTSGLIFISTSFFDFLPPELLTLFIGGFAIALGLWVFKK